MNEFTEMVGCFMRVTWAAAAGKLQLVGSMQPIKDALSLNAHSSRDFCGRQSVGSNGERFSDSLCLCFCLIAVSFVLRLLNCTAVYRLAFSIMY